MDFEEYKKLKNAIAKALVPLLQIWLYATRDKGVFEKRYDEICQLLNITRYPNASLVAQKFGPSLDELKRHGYLSEWRIVKTSDNTGFKIVFSSSITAKSSTATGGSSLTRQPLLYP